MSIKRIFSERKFTGWLLAGVLLAALLIAAPVFAESEVQPVPAAAEGVQEAEAQPLDEAAEGAPDEGPPAEAELPAEILVDDEATAEETTASDEEAQAVVPADEAEASEDAQSVTETQDAAAEESEAVEEPAPAEEAAPAQEPVAIVDASGEAIDLASQASADLIGSGDPWWKVGKTLYAVVYFGGTPGENCPDGTTFNDTCWESATPITDALNKIADPGMLPSDRKLHVKGDTYSETVTINGSTSANWKLLNGLIGEDGSENTILGGSITIVDNTGGFTLQGFTILNSGGIYADGNSGTLKLIDVKVIGADNTWETGIVVQNHRGAVMLEDVEARDNAKNGAVIDNTSGSYPITVTNSVFNNNGNDTTYPIVGLDLWTFNKATLTGVVASGNNGDGIFVTNYKSASITNTYMFFNQDAFSNAYYGYGLYADTDGKNSLTLQNVYAGSNDGGIWVQGGSLKAKNIQANDSQTEHGLTFINALGTAKIEFGEFNGNINGDGLHIENNGTVTLNSIRANDNGVAGAFIETGGSVSLASPTSGGHQQGNEFINNGDAGMTILSGGSVTLVNFDVGDNGSIGLAVDNTAGRGGVTTKVTLKNWANGAFNNGGTGIDIQSNGSVSLNQTGAESNQGEGISIITPGSIRMSRFSASNNSGNGAYLDNTSAPRASSIILTETQFRNNGGFGLQAQSNGAISIKGIAAENNSLRDYHLGSSLGKSISIADRTYDEAMVDTYRFDGTAGETVRIDLDSDDFYVYFEVLDSNGMLIAFDGGEVNHADKTFLLNSYPDIYTVNVQAYNDAGSGHYVFALNDEFHLTPRTPNSNGVVLDNSSGRAGVSITAGSSKTFWNEGRNSMNGNMGTGLKVVSNGTIAITNAAASSNFSTGIYLDNPTSRGAATVQFNKTWNYWEYLDDNGGSGLYVRTMGNITVKNLNARRNGGLGADLDNCLEDAGVCTGFGSIHVLADANFGNYFESNEGGPGLQAVSKGSIKVVNLESRLNSAGEGARLVNNFEGSAGQISMLSSGKYYWNWLSENGADGLYAASNGNISVKNGSFDGNGGNGAHLSNAGSASVRTISLSNLYLGGNDLTGMTAESRGTISMLNGNADSNKSDGIRLDNAGADASGNIIVKGSSKSPLFIGFNGWQAPSQGGLNIVSRGTVTLSSLDVYYNGATGIKIDNNYDALKPKSVSLTDTSINENDGSGLLVETYGSITVKGIDSNNNTGGGGAILTNLGGKGNVTITTTRRFPYNNFDNNSSGSGLAITTVGTVSLKNCSANRNDNHGIWVDTTAGSGNVSFITGGNRHFVNGNGGHGLRINSAGTVTISNAVGLNAFGNGYEGIFVDNTYATAPKTVRLYRIEANENPADHGLEIHAGGTLYAYALTANGNGESGALLTSLGTITLTGLNHFENNGINGLDAQALGSVTVSNVTSRGNAIDGVLLKSINSNVSLTNATLRDNTYRGATLDAANGNFTINKVIAFGNGWSSPSIYSENDGMYIQAGVNSKVTIRYSSFQANGGSGIEIYHPETGFQPSLYKTTYFGNGEQDLWVY